MNINIAGRGVHRREITGVEKLRGLPPDWYAFPNLEIIRAGAMPRQIDIVIVLDDRILLVDLKDWRGKISSDSERWFQNDRVVDTSPVKKILENARILKGELENYLAKKNGPAFNRREVPLVEGCVVLTNKCDTRDIPDFERQRVFYIDDFCRFIKDPGERMRRLAVPPWTDRAHPLTEQAGKWRSLLHSFFGAGGGYFVPLKKRYGDYVVISDETYKHPKDLYAEYDAEEPGATRNFGLLRLWDFSKAHARYASPEGREEVAGREQRVLSYLVDHQPELESVVIRPKVADPDRGIHYWEVFERRRQLKRLVEFVSQRRDDLSPPVRVDLARILLSHVATLHRLGAAHLDLGEHSVWVELPAPIRLSHFVAASYPELKTLGDRRYEFLGSGRPLPEDVLGGAIDHFRKDAFLLACVVHTLLFLRPPRPATAGDPPDWDASVDTQGQFVQLHPWFERALDHQPAERFSDAQQMLDAFIEGTSQDGSAAAMERLDRFRRWKSQLELMRQYPEKQTLLESDRVLMWRSDIAAGIRVVKLWRRANWDDDRLEANRLARFCETAQNYSLARPTGVAQILDVGYMGDSIAVVQEFVDGTSLEATLPHVGAWEGRQVIQCALTLTSNVRALHDRGWSHGDIKPSNIVLRQTDAELTPVLVDVLELVPLSEGHAKTTAYAPKEGVGSQERDRYAVLAIVDEMVRASKLDEPVRQRIAAATGLCREHHPALATIEPLIEALQAVLAPPPSAAETVLVKISGAASGALVPDEGRYHVGVPKAHTVTVTGASEELTVRLDDEGRVAQVRRTAVKQGRVAAAERKAVATVDSPIVVEGGNVNDYGALEQALQEVVVKASDAQQSSAASAAGLAASAETEIDEDNLVEPERPEAEPPTVDVAALWRTLIDVELEQFTQGVADGDSAYVSDRRRHFVPYQGRKGTLDFAREDKIAVEILLPKGKGWIQVGLLDADLSRDDMIAVDATGQRGESGGTLCSPGTEIRFRSIMETDSRNRRDTATKRILARQSVVTDLIDYFDPAAAPSAKPADRVPDQKQIMERYGLNESQAEAFVGLWESRPVSLLQGPPGTGKTKFIAAAVHYLLSTGQVKNVLLASQSHEAVNNAAESVLRLFRQDGTEPSLVRVGQEGNVSDMLKPYHSANVEAKYREQFRASLKQRFGVVGNHIGVSAAFIDDFFFLEATLWPVFHQVQDLTADIVASNEPSSDRNDRVANLTDTLQRLGSLLCNGEVLASDWTQPGAYDEAVASLGRIHGATPDQVRRMRTVAHLAQDWMGSVSSRRRSFEEFLANTRQIVCGTCVGLGRSSLGLTSAQFDLVVVDEAARCTPSELAVPIQSGRWVLLVGDHCQLEPFHEPEVLREAGRRLGAPATALVRSDFERAFSSAYGRRVGRTLTTQYRMLPTIGRIVSEVFYGNRLTHGRNDSRIPDEALPELLKDEVVWIRTDDLGEGAYQKKSGGTSLHNPVEADVIVDIVLALDDHEPFTAWLSQQPDGEKAVGIICTYADQRELIRRRLNAAGVSGRLLAACKIDTVDSYQGKENAVVILSLVRNNADGKGGSGERQIAQGYMARGNRINVAMSRAMDRLLIVGASERWPQGGPMSDVATCVGSLVSEGSASFIDGSALVRDRTGDRVRHLRRTGRAHQRNVRTS